MSTTAKKAAAPAKRVFGLSPEDIESFHMENGDYSSAGHHSLHVVHHAMNANVRQVAEKFGSIGVGDRLESQGMGFLRNRKSKNGKFSLFDSLTKLAAGSAADTDLIWLSPGFPKVTCVIDPTHSEPTKRTPVPTAPGFLFFDYPPEDPVNSLVPGKVLRCAALCVLEFTDGKGVVDPLIHQCAKTRILSLLAAEGKKFDISFLNPRIRVAKMALQFVTPGEPIIVDPTLFFKPEDADKPVTAWPLSAMNPGNTATAIRLPSFAASELDADTWKTRLLDLPTSSFNLLFKADTMWDRSQWTGGLDRKKAEALLKQVDETSQSLMDVAAEVFPAEAATLKANNPLSHRRLYVLCRIKDTKVTALPKISEPLIDGNLIIRPNV